ncbi:MAG: ribonuclease J [Candidatus Paceibacterota bacterium]
MNNRNQNNQRQDGVNRVRRFTTRTYSTISPEEEKRAANLTKQTTNHSEPYSALARSFSPKPPINNNNPRTANKNPNRNFNKRLSPPIVKREVSTINIKSKDLGKRAHQNPKQHRDPINKKESSAIIPPLERGNIRIIPLGGVEEIGKNMTLIEYNDDIVVIDAGFQFKEEETPGIDYILPNTKYLETRKNKVRALFITHGHLDHVGAIPYIMDRIGNPPIYTRNLTSLMIKKRQSEFPHLDPIDFKVIENNEEISIGGLKVKFFGVMHSIPDCMGIIIRTPYGNIVTPGDYKLDHENGIPTENEEEVYKIFDNEKNLLLLTDSTNIENPGFSTPEKIVQKNLEDIVVNTKGRLIMTMFASHILRIVSVIQVAEKYGKKIFLEGRSMKNNVEIVIQAGLLTVKKDTIVSSQNMDSYPPDRVVILATGGQGEEFAALMRMANKAHKNIRINERDTVVLSSSIVPGNEKSVQKLKDNLARQGVKIVHYRTSDVFIHSTGHGNRGEIEWLHKKIKAKFFIPIHGSHYMLRLHAELANNLGVPSENIIVPDNGSIIEIQDNGNKMVKLPVKAPSGIVMVDGFAIGDIQEVVIRDRQMLAEDGFVVIVASINTSTGKLKKSPDIISRGFVYLRESQDLLKDARNLIKKTVEESTEGMHPINFDYVKNIVSDNLGRFLFQKTAKRPIVIPVLIGV